MEGPWYPESEYKSWEELNLTEQEAARELCYLPETWTCVFLDGEGGVLSLEQWTMEYSSLAANQSTVSPSTST